MWGFAEDFWYMLNSRPGIELFKRRKLFAATLLSFSLGEEGKALSVGPSTAVPRFSFGFVDVSS